MMLVVTENVGSTVEIFSSTKVTFQAEEVKVASVLNEKS